MDRRLKSDIDQLFDGEPQEIRAARQKLRLNKEGREPDLTGLENRIWREFEGRQQEKTGALVNFRNFFKKPLVIPAFAMAVAVAAVGVHFLGQDRGEFQQLVQFDYSQNALSNFSFRNKIGLKLRQASDFKLANRGDHFELKATKIWGQFEFEKKPGNSLAIETPFGTFSVTGTSFLLFVNDKQAMLLVEEGTVQVESHGERLFVRANEQFSATAAVKVTAIPESSRKIFAAFRNPALKNEELKANTPVTAISEVKPIQVTVTLFDGNSLTGELVQESQEMLVIRPKNFGRISIRKNEIRERR